MLVYVKMMHSVTPWLVLKSSAPTWTSQPLMASNKVLARSTLSAGSMDSKTTRRLNRGSLGVSISSRLVSQESRH